MNEKLVEADYRIIVGDLKKTGEKVDLSQILLAKENRQAFQRRLLATFNSPLVCLTVNYPGSIKSNFYTKIIFAEGLKSIVNDVNSLFKVVNLRFTGEEGYLIAEGNARELKRILSETEETHPLGRFMDIDVLDDKGKQISRENIGLSPRKCLLCEKTARECYVLRNHSSDELKAFIDGKVEEFLKKKYGN